MVMDSSVISSARLWGAESAASPLVDVQIRNGRVASVVPAGSAGLEGERIDLAGRWLMPGMVDHHVHFTLWAKHRNRLSLAGTSSAADAADRVRIALAADLPHTQSPLVGRGFQDALWADAPTAELLDDVAARVGQLHRPIVLISHDLHSVWINTAASVLFGTAAGLLREEAAFNLEIALESVEAGDPARVEAQVAEAVAAANMRGVTGIMDLEMADNPTMWARRVASGLVGLRVLAGVYPQHLEKTVARGERTGKRMPGTGGLVTVGPLKVFADGALNTRTAWCFDPYPHSSDFGHSAHPRGDLDRVLRDARDQGFEIALHAIGDRAVAEALDAYEASGATGSIEHAQLVRDEDIPRFAALGVAAGIHPEHALDDRDVTDALWAGRTDRAFPYGSLARAGVALRMGSDAPVAPLNPWKSLSAAVHRTRDELPAWGLDNGLDLLTALRASWAVPAVREGVAADLIALDHDPAALDVGAMRDTNAAATFTAGRLVHAAL